MKILLTVLLSTMAIWSSEPSGASANQFVDAFNKSFAESQLIKKDIRQWAIARKCSEDSVEAIFVIENASKYNLKIRGLRDIDLDLDWFFSDLRVSNNYEFDVPKNSIPYFTVAPEKLYAACLKTKIDASDSMLTNKRITSFSATLKTWVLINGKEKVLLLQAPLIFNPDSKCDKLINMLQDWPAGLEKQPE